MTHDFLSAHRSSDFGESLACCQILEVSPSSKCCILTVDFASDVKSCLFWKRQIFKRLIFAVGCWHLNHPNLVKHVHTVSLQNFVLAAWGMLRQQMHAASVFVRAFQTFLDYKFQFLGRFEASRVVVLSFTDPVSLNFFVELLAEFLCDSSFL